MTQTEELEELFKRHYRALCLYATHFTGDLDQAEDIVMNCFLKLAERLSAGHRVEWGGGYLYSMVRNACLDQRTLRLPMERTADIPDQPDEEAEALRERSEREARLWGEIDRLPPACRQVLLMSKRDGLPYREIAEALGLSVKTVESHMRRAYIALRGQAERIYFFFF